jgi:ABC-type Zn2+ transport system substrate-binding protein/surface adhesin
VTAYLMANIIQNEVVTIHKSQEVLKMLPFYEEETGNEEQEEARHTKHNKRAHQRDHTCNNRKIAEVPPTRF